MDCNEEKRTRPIFDAAHILALAAAPTFAIMALLTPILGAGARDMLCSAAMQNSSPLSGMVPMYLLMSAFHSAPWLKLISDRQSVNAAKALQQTAARLSNALPRDEPDSTLLRERSDHPIRGKG